MLPIATLAARVRGSLRWRRRILQRDLFLLGRFRNSFELSQSLRTGAPCAKALFRGGARLDHPPDRAGLAHTLLEIFHERCYTPGHFYQPAPGDTIVDAGANVGIFTFWASRQNPRGRILALEPFPENFALLERNVAFNRLAGVTSFQVALGGTAGQGVMQAGVGRSLDHRLCPESTGGGEAVGVVSLGDLFGMAKSDSIAFLKMDIEGSEHDAFMKSDTALFRRFRRIAVEYHDNLRPGTLALLQGRLGETHRLTVRPDGAAGYGILLAELRE
jgi:FkbM family methyltransferase